MAASAIQRFQKKESYKAEKSTGRPKRFDAKLERKLICEVQNNPKTSAEKIRVMWNSFSTINGVSAKTIRRVLHKYGIRSRSGPKTIAIRPKTALNRIRWRNQHKIWSVADRRRIVFTDEVRFRLFCDGRVTVSKRNGKKFDPSCVVSKCTDKRSMMFWAIIHSDGQKMLSKSPDRMKTDDYVRILHQAPGDVITDAVILQHEKCPFHKVEIVNDWLRDNQIPAIDWPSYRPDLILIENVWAIMQLRIASQHLKFNNLEEIVQMTRKCITLETISKLNESMPERMKQVIKNKGFKTNFWWWYEFFIIWIYFIIFIIFYYIIFFIVISTVWLQLFKKRVRVSSFFFA